MITTIVIVEDDRDFRTTLTHFVNETPGYRCIQAFDSGEDALKAIPGLKPDVVLMDIHLPKMSGVACTRQLKELCPSTRILILTVYEDSERIFGALKSGANGYLLKRADPADIIRAIQEVKRGGAPMSSQVASRVVESFYENSRVSSKEQKLSQREEEILEELSKGYTTKEIANRFSISANTVHTHLQHIYDKLHVRSRTEAVLKYLS
ncbi:MAG: response regulator transcription factor [Verrucomicrobiota bacterium]|jgi:DNA-binding NarL/FixJ family response regulator